MKRSAIKLFGAFVFLLIFVTSCENFQNSYAVRKQIEDAIAYNNSPAFTISFDYPESSGIMRSPGGSDIIKKVTDTFTIWFDPLTGYEFISWKIVDSATNKEIQNGEYLTLENIDQAQTTCSFTKAPPKDTKLCLIPIIAERPQIIFNSPVSLSTLKDSQIQVRFDHDMDPYSIYFTDAEIAELKNAGIADTDFLPPLDDTQKNHYGYKKDGEVFFKNITIKNERTGQSLNNVFDAPVFENPRALSISVKDKDTLYDFTPILVTIEKGFFYTVKTTNDENGKPVEMSDKKTWLYQVNAKTDNKPPIIPKQGNKDSIKIKLSDETELNLQDYLSITNEGAGIETLKFIKDNKIYLDLQVQDPENGSGPISYFELYATKTFDSNYKDLRVVDEDTYQYISPIYYENPLLINYQTVSSDSAVFKGEIDLSALNLEDGVYDLYLLIYDKSENKMEYPSYEILDEWYRYYFAIDNEFSMPEPMFTDESSSEVKFKISWEPCIDLAKTVVRYKKQNENDWSEPETILHGSSFTYITGLDFASEYEFEISFYDYAGHEQQYILSKITDEWGIFVTGESTKKIYFVGDSFEKDGLTVTLKNLLTNEERILNTNEWQVEFDSQNVGIDKKAIIKYETEERKKIVETDVVYYVAAANALTENIIKINDKDYKFGDFPQTIAAHQEDSYYTEEPVYPKEHPWWYLGTDGYFYEKCVENAYFDGLWYSDKSYALESRYNNTRYFKVEPIKWTKYTSDDKDIIVSETVLTGNIPYYLDTGNRTISEQTVYPNNYKYSTLRAYLNGSYEEDDPQPQQNIYTNCGFLQKAFTPAAQELIVETDVDNSLESCLDYNATHPSSVTQNDYICNNTLDKIFVLSESFVSYFYHYYAEFKDHQVTDYAIANYAIMDNPKSIAGGWLRTPGNSSTSACIYSLNSTVKRCDVDKKRNILPALRVFELPE